MRGWRAALRIARRDAARSKGRSLLVLVMIALPVLGVTVADVLIQTVQIGGDEALERRLGAADALVRVEPGVTTFVQGADPERGATWGSGSDPGGRPVGLDEIETLLGGEVRALEYREGSARVRTPGGARSVGGIVLDLGDPLAKGLFDLTSGRWPRGPGEVVVDETLARSGLDVGSAARVGPDGQPRRVVGTLRAGSRHHGDGEDALVAGPPGSVDLRRELGTRWLVEAGPVTWEEVQALNAVGASVLSRAVLLDPPPDSALPPEIREGGTVREEDLALAVLVAVMALLEVALLAGPAFAVGARRQARVLAMMAAQGATPAQARRVVLAGAAVLGGAASALGVLGGILAAWLLVPLVQRFTSDRLGPFDVPWPHLVGIAAFGLVSAVLAALVPAWIASRQDVVAVLAGRRGDRPAGIRFPLLGVGLLTLGVAGAAYGAQQRSAGEYVIAAAAVVVVLGVVLVVPVVLSALTRVSRRLPLTLRYALRDAARHRARTVPAVAAVAATVCGVVAIGIATSSDEAQARAEYVPLLRDGAMTVISERPLSTDWEAVGDELGRALPGARVTRLSGPALRTGAGGEQMLDLRRVGRPGEDGVVRLDQWGAALGTELLVSDGGWPAEMRDAPWLDEAAAERTLRAGGVVVFTSEEVPDRQVRISGRWGPRGERARASGTFPARFVTVPASHAQGRAVLPRAVVDALGIPVGTVALHADGVEVDVEDGREASARVAAVAPEAIVTVERGFQGGGDRVLVQLILGALGAALMLSGTLTATFLALSDARPDLATLAAVGASPRRRRGVAAAYALVVGGIGALLGVLAGLVPGIAVTYPMTSSSWLTVDAAGRPMPDHHLAVPWLLIGVVVVGLPLLTAAVVGLCARSRLPLSTRLD